MMVQWLKLVASKLNNKMLCLTDTNLLSSFNSVTQRDVSPPPQKKKNVVLEIQHVWLGRHIRGTDEQNLKDKLNV